MTPQELKNSILQLAIQGKLVEQRSEEGTAEDLYQQIQTEEQRLIIAGKIKKDAALPDITEDEIPFDIPDAWKWVRLGDCSSYAQRKEKVSASNITEDMWSLDLEDIEKDTGRIINRCRAAERGIVGDKVQFYGGQILYSKLRPYLKKVLVAPDNGICSSEMVPFAAYGGICAQYLVYVLKAPHVDYVVNSVTYGVKMPRVGTETMVNLLIPLPPLAEQKRIVDKIEELLPYIDRYEQAWSKLEDFNKRFPNDMLKSILQLAIQGKLVEQRPEEGTAEELYQQIQAEKQQLIKAGTIKKEKPLREITEDEKPFDIPETWAWVRLSSICKSIADGDHQAPPQVPSGVPFLVISNLSSGVIDFSTTRHVPHEYFNNLSPERVAENGDIIFTVTGSYGIPVKVDCDIRFCFQRHMALLKTLIHKKYLFYLLKSPVVKEQCDNVATGTAQKTVGLNSLRNITVPLPPLAEQKRIVAKLEDILPLFESKGEK